MSGSPVASAARLLPPPVNALRLALHLEGIAPRIANLGQWRAHLLARLRRQAALTGYAALAALHEELLGCPGRPAPDPSPGPAEEVVALRPRHDGGELRLLSTMSTFGTPQGALRRPGPGSA
ncbi:hypothetical protein ACFT9M_24890 [Micromonospora purpureochromogenes]|uniref:MmyB family transcriptional regulator n=1 Tax=Micromonospora purpureochromogenes TaxID=47872 RepID=UPI003634901C